MDPVMFGCYSNICIKFKYDQNCQDPGLALYSIIRVPHAHPAPRGAEVIFSPNYARARSLDGEALIAPHSQNAAPSPIISDFYSQFSLSQFASPHFLGGRERRVIGELPPYMTLLEYW